MAIYLRDGEIDIGGKYMDNQVLIEMFSTLFR